MNSKYTFNGISYNSLDEMPEDIRKHFDQISNIFTDADENGVPDIVEGKLDPSNILKEIQINQISDNISITRNHFIVNGEVYNSIEDMPESIRDTYKLAMKDISKNDESSSEFDVIRNVKIEKKKLETNSKYSPTFILIIGIFIGAFIASLFALFFWK
jgi:hypothetical protein